MFCKKLSIFNNFFLAREIHFILIHSKQISLIHSLSFSLSPHYFLPCVSAGVYTESGTHSLMNIVLLLISHWVISSLSLKPPFFSHSSQLNLVLLSLPLVSPQLPCPSVLAFLNTYVHKSCRFLNFILAFFHCLHLSVSQKSPKQGFSFSITFPRSSPQVRTRPLATPCTRPLAAPSLTHLRQCLHHLLRTDPHSQFVTLNLSENLFGDFGVRLALFFQCIFFYINFNDFIIYGNTSIKNDFSSISFNIL